MDDLYRAFDDRAQVILQRIDAQAVGPAGRRDRIDRPRAAHDVAPDRSDAPDVRQGAGGEVRRLDRARLPQVRRLRRRGRWRASDPTTPILIVSDHGFHSFRQSVNLNTWLVQEGFMAIQRPAPGEKKLQDLFGGGTFWENVDWTRTRAYAMGLGQIYVNLQGPRRPRHRRAAPSRRACRTTLVGAAPDDDRSEDRGADGRRGLQARRHLQGAVPARTRPSCRSASPTATACRGRRRSAARRRASSTRT